MEHKKCYYYKYNTNLPFFCIVVTLRKGGLYSSRGYVMGDYLKKVSVCL